MAKKSVGDLSKADLEGKVVFVRADLNVPLDGSTITDDTRIRAAVPTLKYLADNGAKVVLSSHLGRPKDGPEDKFRLTPCAVRLTELLGKEVKKTDDCIGPEVEAAVKAMSNGDVLLLENVRFYKEEEKNDPEFAKKLASVADLYVNDAFGTAHRAHASTEGVTKYLSPSVAGFLLEKELTYLDGAVANPKRPFAAIVGGSKVSSKIGVIESLLQTCDKIIIGGGMIFTFYKARGAYYYYHHYRGGGVSGERSDPLTPQEPRTPNPHPHPPTRAGRGDERGGGAIGWGDERGGVTSGEG